MPVHRQVDSGIPENRCYFDELHGKITALIEAESADDQLAVLEASLPEDSLPGERSVELYIFMLFILIT